MISVLSVLAGLCLAGRMSVDAVEQKRLTDRVYYHNVSITHGAGRYYTLNGGNEGWGLLNIYNRQGRELGSQRLDIDGRGLYLAAGGEFLYLKPYGTDLYRLDLSGSNLEVVQRGLFRDEQSSPAYSPEEGCFYELTDGTVYVLDVQSGRTRRSFSLPSAPDEYGHALATSGRNLFTHSETGLVRCYTMDGVFLASARVPDGFGFSLSWADECLWVADDADGADALAPGTWRGYTLASHSLVPDRYANAPEEAPEQAPVSQEAQPPAPPELSFDVRLDEQTADKMLSGGETVGLSVTVRNTGEGPASGVAVHLAGTSPAVGYLGSVKQVGTVPAKGSRIASFSAKLPARIPDVRGSIVVSVSEASGYDALHQKELLVNTAPIAVQRETLAVVPIPAVRQEVAKEPDRKHSDDLVRDIPRGPRRPNSIAVIVGLCSYDGLPDVVFAKHDAEAVMGFAETLLGYDAGDVIYLADPSKAELEMVFGSAASPQGQLYNWVKPGKSDVFVYYAGHGAPSLQDRKGYLLPRDASPDYVHVTGYPLDLLYSNLDKVPAKSVTVVIDACFSGLVTDSEGGVDMLIRDASPIGVTVVSDEASQGLTILTAATGSQVASWYPEKGHSMFTYWFLKGLKGDADVNGDKTITLGEMKDYLSENVTYTARRLYGREQTPEVRGDPGTVLARLR